MLNRLLPFALLLSVALACAESPRPTPSSQSSSVPGASPVPVNTIAITASNLFAAYEANEVAADEAYKNKILKITGKVDTVGKDILDTMYVTLGSGVQYSFGNVQCMFADEHKSELMQLHKGQTVTVVGTCNGKLGNVLVKNCYLDK